MQEPIPSEPPKEIPPQRALLYEHLFPGSKWNDLTIINPLLAPSLFKRMMWDDDTETGKFGRSVEGEQGYARRIDVGGADRLTMAYNLLYTLPTQENPASLKGWVADLLKPDEKLGGVGVKQMIWLKKVVREDGLLTLVPAAVGNQDLFDEASATVLGVLTKEGRPSALINFRKGPRPTDEIIKERIITSTPLIAPIGVKI